MLVKSEKTCKTVRDAVDFIMDECKNKDMRIDRLVKENKRLTDEMEEWTRRKSSWNYKIF